MTWDEKQQLSNNVVRWTSPTTPGVSNTDTRRENFMLANLIKQNKSWNNNNKG